MGFSDYVATRLNCPDRLQLASPRLEIVSRDGSKDTSKRDNHISANRRRLDCLDDKRGRDQLPRPKSKHQARRPRTLRDILRPRGTTRIQGNRRMKNTKPKPDKETVRRMESTTTTSKREKTQNKCQHIFLER